MEPVKYRPEDPNRKFSTDAAKALLAIIVLIMLAIAPAVVIAAWRAIL